MTATSRKSGGGSHVDPEAVLFFIAVGVVAIVVAIITAAVRLGAVLEGGVHGKLPGNPITLTARVIAGKIVWSSSVTTALVGVLVVVASVGGVGWVLWRRRKGRGSRVDRAARRMGRGRDLEPIGRRQAAATAKRLGVDSPGLVIGRAVAGGQALYQGWEDVSIDIWGPRVGKTTSRVIPAILEAPGAVVTTSNKRDVVDATRDLRGKRAQVWVFDPQGLVNEPADWWWNPLSFVVDEVKAEMLAELFASNSRDASARTDAYFDAAAQRLLANLLLAAAIAGRALTQVYLWLTEPTEDEGVGILEAAGYPLLAASLLSTINLPEKQRGGVYGTAQQIASFMTNREAMRWATDDQQTLDGNGGGNGATSSAGRRQFDAHDFVRGSDTLYLLSKEGRGSAGPLVTALTVAVCEAAEDYARECPGGRLPVPLVAALDEAANCVPYRELPNVYSHWGSRGICVMTILQSWSQGEQVWGKEGMRKLWSAANVKVYGGGVSEVGFLKELSELVGNFDLDMTSVSRGRDGRSTSQSVRREEVLDVGDLQGLPRGRAVVLASGAPATLARTLPWMAGPYAKEVLASIAIHDPAAVAQAPVRQAGTGTVELPVDGAGLTQ